MSRYALKTDFPAKRRAPDMLTNKTSRTDYVLVRPLIDRRLPARTGVRKLTKLCGKERVGNRRE